MRRATFVKKVANYRSRWSSGVYQQKFKKAKNFVCKILCQSKNGLQLYIYASNFTAVKPRKG
jgi:hypothetical protein